MQILVKVGVVIGLQKIVAPPLFGARYALKEKRSALGERANPETDRLARAMGEVVQRAGLVFSNQATLSLPVRAGHGRGGTAEWKA
jgi:hypothetical protein